jgi:hypothetical protein
MEVQSARHDWEEADMRERRWVKLDDAIEMLKPKGLDPFVCQALDRLQVGAGRD